MYIRVNMKTNNLYILISAALIGLSSIGYTCTETATDKAKTVPCIILQGFPKDDSPEQIPYESIPLVSYSVSSTATLSDVSMGTISSLTRV